MVQRFSWFGVLVITTLSGLIVRVVGDPLVDMTSPQIEDVFDDLEDWFDETQEAWDDWWGDR
jgi:hypothetical protein